MFLWLLIAVISLSYVYFKKKYSYWKDLGFPYPEPSIPMGNLSGVGYKEHLSDFVIREYNKFKDKGPAFGIYLFTKPTLTVTDVNLIKEVTTNSFESFNEREFYINEKADPLMKNLFTSGEKVWKNLREKLSPAFTDIHTKLMFPIFNEKADRMIEYLKQPDVDHQNLEMKEIFASYTSEVISSAAFGMDIKCLGHPDNEFRKCTRFLFEPPMWYNFKIFLIFSWPQIAKFLNMAQNPQFVIDFFIKTVRENYENREKNNIRRDDFFQMLIDMKNNQEITFEEMAANSYIFLIAGLETSSSSIMFCTYELALNQDIQDRLRNEIESVIKKHNGEVTYDAIMEMKYLDMVFNETLRKYPIFEVQIRKCTKEYKIPGTNLIIHSGMPILIPVIGIHMDEKYFENPEKFDPERFNEENVKKLVPHTYVPFSEGPRNCIGTSFGTMQAKVGLVKFLRNFRVHPSNKTLIPMKYAPNYSFQSPLGGMWLKMQSIK
uniref:Cytochrome P450 6EV9 n=1 Tax=Chironomus kiiensis TaxID=84408 RepID=W6E8V1_CHIKI|nr:cytochrome P450 6EV9 [Chironomus kiiensis]